MKVFHFYAVQQKEPGRERWVEGTLQIETEFDFSIAGAMQEIRRRIAEKDEELDPKELQVQSLTLLTDLTPTEKDREITKLRDTINTMRGTDMEMLRNQIERCQCDFAYLQKQVTESSLIGWLKMRESAIKYLLETKTFTEPPSTEENKDAN